MMFPLFFVLIFFCTFQVDLALSSWQKRRNELLSMQNDSQEIIEKLELFYTEEFEHSKSLLNLTFESIERVSSVIYSTLAIIESEANEAEKKGKNADFCYNTAINKLKELVAFDCGAFGKCRNISMASLTTIYQKMQQVIKSWELIIKNINESDSHCLSDVNKTANASDVYAEICYFCKIPEVRLSVIAYNRTAEIFKRRSINFAHGELENAYVCFSEAETYAKAKIDSIKKEADHCVRTSHKEHKEYKVEDKEHKDKDKEENDKDKEQKDHEERSKRDSHHTHKKE